MRLTQKPTTNLVSCEGLSQDQSSERECAAQPPHSQRKRKSDNVDGGKQQDGQTPR